VNSTAPSSTMTAALDALDRLAAERGIRLVTDAPLAPITTLRVGGPADRLAEPRSADELLAVLGLARDAGVQWLVIGNGSNLVVADRGVRGLVIRNRARSVHLDGSQLEADGGTPLALVVKRTAAAGLTGMEWAIAVPGTVGGAVWANAGAHGGQMADVLDTVAAWDPATGALRTVAGEACGFAYRESRFKHEPLVVIRARLTLEADDPRAVAERVAAFGAHRAATQPVADQNAGSVFRNPPGDFAGRLIEAAGMKGVRRGTAAVSDRHANFIVTERGARAEDVRRLAEQVRAAVQAASGVALAYEIEFVGEWNGAERAA